MPITSKSAYEIASLCSGFHKVSDGYRARCPAHNGDNPESLHIWEKEGKTYIKCHAHDCKPNDILKAIGIEPDRMPRENLQDIYYYYEDANGHITFRVKRYYVGNEKKFIQQHPHPSAPGGYKDGRNNAEPVLYRLPKIIDAVRDGKTILILEGEKDVHTAESLGYVATTNPGGADAWKQLHADALKGGNIVYIPDDDKAGRKHEASVESTLKNVKLKSYVKLKLNNLERGGDLTDWIQAGGTKAELDALIENSRANPHVENTLLSNSNSIIKSDLRSMFDQASYSEITAGKQLIAEHGHNLHFVHRWNAWLTYQDGVWQRDESGILDQYAKNIIAKIGHEAKNWLSNLLELEEGEIIGMKPKQIENIAQDIAAKHGEEGYKKTIIEIGKAKNLYTHSLKITSKLSDIINMAKSEDGIHIPISSLDNHPFKLVCRNGVIDLTSGSLIPFDPSYLITRRINIDYDPNATAPTWLRFVMEIMGDPIGDDDPDMSASVLVERESAHRQAIELASYLQRAVGYSITGSVRDQVMFVLHGSGANGKSLFISMLMEILGGLAKKATSRLFMHKKNPDHPTEVADLFGKRFVAAVETDEDQRLDESFIKEVTGNDIISARHMHEDFWEFEPTHKLWLATNHRPQIRDVSYAMFRRLQLIPFNVRFQMPNMPIDTQLPRADLSLESSLKAELPGILSWAVRGAMEWHQNGLNPPQAVQDATEDYRQDQDTFGQFLEEKCILGASFSMVYSEAWEVFKSWAEDCNRHPGTKNAFSRKLTSRGFDRRKSDSKVLYIGIGLRRD